MSSCPSLVSKRARAVVMESPPEGYRRNVGICLLSPAKKVFTALGINIADAWQMPQELSHTGLCTFASQFEKRIRGITYSTKVSSQFENTMTHSSHGIFNHLLPDVHIFTDHKAGPQAGNSPGYGISLVAETTSGCFISADTTISYARGDDVDEMEDDEEKKELMPPEEVGEQIASVLLQEIEQGGVVDSTHRLSSGSIFVDKTDGCKYMKCRCRTSFCYTCGSTVPKPIIVILAMQLGIGRIPVGGEEALVKLK